jgi:ferredoxin-nitrate reductase
LVEDLKEANRLKDPYDIQMGDALEIPISVINVPLHPYMPYRLKD